MSFFELNCFQICLITCFAGSSQASSKLFPNCESTWRSVKVGKGWRKLLIVVQKLKLWINALFICAVGEHPQNVRMLFICAVGRLLRMCSHSPLSRKLLLKSWFFFLFWKLVYRKYQLAINTKLIRKFKLLYNKNCYVNHKLLASSWNTLYLFLRFLIKIYGKNCFLNIFDYNNFVL